MDDVALFMIPTVTIVGGVALILMAMYQHTRRLEMRHRERMAMIDKGLAPPPERDPSAFEPARPHGSNRATSVGIATVAIGVGLMLLIGVAAGAPEAAIGVGGAVVVLGAAFIVNGRLTTQARQMSPPPPPSDAH
jgi:hypothetical protein